MSGTVETWIVVADDAGARVFEERRRLGRLIERADLAMQSHEDRHRAPGNAATVVDRSGFGRHASATVDPAARAEQHFLTRVCDDDDANRPARHRFDGGNDRFAVPKRHAAADDNHSTWPDDEAGVCDATGVFACDVYATAAHDVNTVRQFNRS